MRNRILPRSIIIFISIFLLFSISRAQSREVSRTPVTTAKSGSNLFYGATGSVSKPELKSTVQPNPFSQSFIINTSLRVAQPLKLQLLDMNGNLVRYKSVNGQPGENRIELSDLGNLQAGVYLLRIIKPDSVIEQRVVKSKN